MATKTITVGKDGFINLSNFSDMVDTSKVEYYEFKINKDKVLTLKFYDKNKKLIKPKKELKNEQK